MINYLSNALLIAGSVPSALAKTNNDINKNETQHSKFFDRDYWQKKMTFDLVDTPEVSPDLLNPAEARLASENISESVDTTEENQISDIRSDSDDSLEVESLDETNASSVPTEKKQSKTTQTISKIPDMAEDATDSITGADNEENLVDVEKEDEQKDRRLFNTNFRTSRVFNPSVRSLESEVKVESYSVKGDLGSDTEQIMNAILESDASSVDDSSVSQLTEDETDDQMRRLEEENTEGSMDFNETSVTDDEEAMESGETDESLEFEDDSDIESSSQERDMVEDERPIFNPDDNSEPTSRKLTEEKVSEDSIQIVSEAMKVPRNSATQNVEADDKSENTKTMKSSEPRRLMERTLLSKPTKNTQYENSTTKETDSPDNKTPINKPSSDSKADNDSYNPETGTKSIFTTSPKPTSSDNKNDTETVLENISPLTNDTADGTTSVFMGKPSHRDIVPETEEFPSNNEELTVDMNNTDDLIAKLLPVCQQNIEEKLRYVVQDAVQDAVHDAVQEAVIRFLENQVTNMNVVPYDKKDRVKDPKGHHNKNSALKSRDVASLKILLKQLTSLTKSLDDSNSKHEDNSANGNQHDFRGKFGHGKDRKLGNRGSSSYTSSTAIFMPSFKKRRGDDDIVFNNDKELVAVPEDYINTETGLVLPHRAKEMVCKKRADRFYQNTSLWLEDVDSGNYRCAVCDCKGCSKVRPVFKPQPVDDFNVDPQFNQQTNGGSQKVNNDLASFQAGFNTGAPARRLEEVNTGVDVKVDRKESDNSDIKEVHSSSDGSKYSKDSSSDSKMSSDTDVSEDDSISISTESSEPGSSISDSDSYVTNDTARRLMEVSSMHIPEYKSIVVHTSLLNAKDANPNRNLFLCNLIWNRCRSRRTVLPSAKPKKAKRKPTTVWRKSSWKKNSTKPRIWKPTVWTPKAVKPKVWKTTGWSSDVSTSLDANVTTVSVTALNSRAWRTTKSTNRKKRFTSEKLTAKRIAEESKLDLCLTKLSLYSEYLNTSINTFKTYSLAKCDSELTSVRNKHVALTSSLKTLWCNKDYTRYNIRGLIPDDISLSTRAKQNCRIIKDCKSTKGDKLGTDCQSRLICRIKVGKNSSNFERLFNRLIYQRHKFSPIVGEPFPIYKPSKCRTPYNRGLFTFSSTFQRYKVALQNKRKIKSSENKAVAYSYDDLLSKFSKTVQVKKEIVQKPISEFQRMFLDLDKFV